MGWLTRMFTRSRDFEDLSAELRQHLQEKTDELVESGMSRADAEAAARRAFGNPIVIEERAREAWGSHWIDIISQDIRYAQRQLRRNPGFACTALLLLSVGIGACTAVFTVARQVLLSGLAVQHPEELIQVRTDNQTDNIVQRHFSYPAFRILSRSNPTIQGMYARSDRIDVDVSANGTSDIAQAVFESPNAASVLGLTPALGRLLNAGDDKTSDTPAVVLSYPYWEKRFHGATDAIGKTISINTMPFVIAGVTPSSYHGIEMGVDPDITMPVAVADAVRRVPTINNRNSWGFTVIARRKPDAANEQVLASLEPAFQAALDDWGAGAPPAMAQRFRQFAARLNLRVDAASAGASSESRTAMRQPLLLLALITAIVFLVTCANIAGLTLSRMESRTSELGTRLALGCSPTRLFTQLLTESAWVALIGGILGLLIANWVSPLIPALLGQPQLSTVARPDLAMFLCGFALVLVGGVLLGFVPAIRAIRLDPQVSIRSRSPQSGLRKSRVANTLIVTQIAGSLVLVLAAGQLVRSLRNYQQINAGFVPERLIYVAVRPDLVRYDFSRNRAYVEQVSSRLAQLPGVTSVTYSNSSLGNLHWSTLISFPGYQPSGMANDAVGRNIVGPRFVETMGLRLITGRDFDERDTQLSEPAVIVNESFAKHFFGTNDVLGRSFSFIDSGKRSDTIVGVVADALDRGLKEQAKPVAYSAYAQDPLGQIVFAVRTKQQPGDLMSSVLSAVKGVDPSMPIEQTTTAEVAMSQSLQRERVLAQLTALLGSLVSIVAMLGLYGLLAYSVARRTREIGIRIALGASPRQVRWLLIREGSVLVIAGMAIGYPLYFAVGRVIRAQLFRVPAADPTTTVIALLGLTALAAVATSIPASRSARVDAMNALKYE